MKVLMGVYSEQVCGRKDCIDSEHWQCWIEGINSHQSIGNQCNPVLVEYYRYK